MLNLLKTKSNILIKAPTGSGKSIKQAALCKALVDTYGISVLVLVPKVLLTEQLEKSYKMFGLDTGVVNSTLKRKEYGHQITIATLQSYKEIEKKQVIIIDEVHTLTASGLKLIDELTANYPKLKVIGYSATPYKNNAPMWGDDKFFTGLDYNITATELVKAGKLCNLKIGAPKDASFDCKVLRRTVSDYNQKDLAELGKDRIKAYAQIDDALPRIVNRNHVAWLCVTIEHAEMIGEILTGLGEPNIVIHSKGGSDVGAFESGEVKHVVSVLMLSTGYDYPPLDAVVILRPMRSVTLWSQSCGRAARVHPSKSHGLILDYGGCMDALDHPFNPRLKDAKPRGYKLCPECDSMTLLKECECGYKFKVLCKFCLELKPYGSCDCGGKTACNPDLYKNLTESAHEIKWTSIEINTLYLTNKFNSGVKISYFNGREKIAGEYLADTKKARAFVTFWLKKNLSYELHPNDKLKDIYEIIRPLIKTHCRFIIPYKDGKYFKVGHKK